MPRGCEIKADARKKIISNILLFMSRRSVCVDDSESCSQPFLEVNLILRALKGNLRLLFTIKSLYSSV